MSSIADTAAVDFAGLLKRFRSRTGLTQERLAEAAGLSVEAIRLLEAGRRRQPRPATIKRLANALELPAADLRSLELAAGRPAAEARDGIPDQLPAPIQDFTGRSDQLDHLVRLLSDPMTFAPGVLVSAISGMGGIGKTTLAVQAAHRVASEYPDGQLYLNLRGGGTNPLVPGEALQTLLQSLGVPPIDTTDVQVAAARYRTALAGRRMLLLLDDAANVAQVLPLIPGTATTTVLITSRRNLSELAGVRHLELDVLPENEAVDLLGEIVGHAIVAADPAAARTVVQRSGLLPLAVRIAGGRSESSVEGLQDLAAKLSDTTGRLDSLTGPKAAVNTSIALSLSRLAKGNTAEAAAAEIFPMLGVFDGDWFPLRAAARVLVRSIDETEDLLERLVDLHLLESPALHRYRLHDLVRDIARTGLTRPVLAEAFGREVECYRGMVWRLGELSGAADLYRAWVEPSWSTDAKDLADRDQVLGWLEPELPNLVRVIRQAAAGDSAERLAAVQIALGMTRLATHLMRFGEAYEAMKAVVSIDVDLDLRLQQGRLYQMSLASGALSLSDEALHWRLLDLPLARALAEPVQLVASLLDLGLVLGRCGRLEEGLPHAEEALRLAVEHGVRQHEAGANIALGALVGQLGDLDRQRTLFDRAIELIKLRGLTATAIIHRNLIGEFLQICGRRESALEILTENLAMVRTLRAGVLEADTLEELGRTWLAVGDFTKAREVLAEGVAVSVRYPGENREAPLRHFLGSALSGLGLVEEAQVEWERAIVLYERVADSRADEVRNLKSAR
jgi:transcriptional regulator with XRE-family HTH domain/tetratricopeptide (TPR) repeat protein